MMRAPIQTYTGTADQHDGGCNTQYQMTADSLTDAQFRKLSDFIQSRYGVKMPHQKKLMLQCRLKKRLKALNINTFTAYLNYVFEEENTEEIQNMIDVVTTHKSDFFREKEHFDFITDTVIPEITHRENRTIKILSAGCSTGEEPYTIVMSLLEAQKKKGHFDFEVSAFDVSTESIEKAQEGIYPMNKVNGIPLEFKKKYFLKNTNPQKKLVKIVPEVQKYVRFFTSNLLDETNPIRDRFDIILCRNTLIYFDHHTQEHVLRQLCDKLRPKGYLIIGHSESILGMELPLKQIKPTIFQKNY